LSGNMDIIISTYKRPGFIIPLVSSIKKNCMPCDNIYIVWQGKDMPDAGDENVKFILSSPPNLPKARNRGIREGSGEILLFLDDDVELVNDEILEIHRKVYENSSVGAVAGYIEDPVFVNNGDICSVYDETTGELIQNFSVKTHQETVSFMGAHMSIRRSALEYIRGFDENFTGNSLWEEIDCAFRLRNAGWKIVYCPDAKVRHKRESYGGCRAYGNVFYTYSQFANTSYFAAKHAKPEYRMRWFMFWKNRMEYLSRRRFLWFRHDPLMVAAGIAGAACGIARYCASCSKK
jgi:GT2 family glycosyltransferase